MNTDTLTAALAKRGYGAPVEYEDKPYLYPRYTKQIVDEISDTTVEFAFCANAIIERGFFLAHHGAFKVQTDFIDVTNMKAFSKAETALINLLSGIQEHRIGLYD